MNSTKDEVDKLLQEDAQQELEFDFVEVPVKDIDTDISAAQILRGRQSSRLQDFQGARSTVWLVTFTDAMALMLTFFVLLFSMQQPTQSYWDDFTNALYKGFNSFKGDRGFSGRVQTISLENVDLKQALDLGYLEAILKQTLDKVQSLEKVKMRQSNGELLISMPEKLLFKTGTSQLSDDSKSILSSLSSVFNRVKNQIVIRGHTDSQPIVVKKNYQSNWDLSLDRAIQVAQLLRVYGYQRPIFVQGVADSHQDLLPDQLSLSQKEDISRRVDILILDNDGTIIDDLL